MRTQLLFSRASALVVAAASDTGQFPPRPPRTIITGDILPIPFELQHPIKTGELKIITQDFTEQTSLPSGLTEEDKERLFNDNILIKDKRDHHKTSIPYNVQTDKAFFNPGQTGLFDILTRAGKFEKCLVLCQPQGPQCRVDFSTVIRLSEPRNWRNISHRSLWAVNLADANEHEPYRKWFEGLSDIKEPTPGSRQHYVAIGPMGDCTLPFRVVKRLGDQFDSDVYEVSFDTSCLGPYDFPTNAPRYGTSAVNSEPLGYGYDCGERLHLNGKDGASIRSNRGDIYVPKSFKLLAIEPDAADKDDTPDNCCISGVGQSENPPILPGNITDVELNIIEKTAEFKLWSNGSQVQINNGPSLTQLDGLISLVRDHGFNEADARGLLKRAARQKKFTCRVIYPDYIKAAADPYLAGQGPTSPAFPATPYGGGAIMGSHVPTQLELQHEQPVMAMRPEVGNRAYYDPTQNLTGPEQHTLRQSLEMGQKEIFDTSMVSSMLRGGQGYA